MAGPVQGDQVPSVMDEFLFCSCRWSQSGLVVVAVIHNIFIICGFLGLGLCRSLPVHGNSLSFVAWDAGGADRFRRMDRV